MVFTNLQKATKTARCVLPTAYPATKAQLFVTACTDTFALPLIEQITHAPVSNFNSIVFAIVADFKVYSAPLIFVI